MAPAVFGDMGSGPRESDAPEALSGAAPTGRRENAVFSSHAGVTPPLTEHQRRHTIARIARRFHVTSSSHSEQTVQLMSSVVIFLFHFFRAPFCTCDVVFTTRQAAASFRIVKAILKILFAYYSY